MSYAGLISLGIRGAGFGPADMNFEEAVDDAAVDATADVEATDTGMTERVSLDCVADSSFNGCDASLHYDSSAYQKTKRN